MQCSHTFTNNTFIITELTEHAHTHMHTHTHIHLQTQAYAYIRPYKHTHAETMNTQKGYLRGTGLEYLIDEKSTEGICSSIIASMEKTVKVRS